MKYRKSKLSETTVLDSDYPLHLESLRHYNNLTLLTFCLSFNSLKQFFLGSHSQSLLPVYVSMLPTLLEHYGDIYVQL